MSNLHFENQGTHTYLVTAITENDEVDSMSLGMITNNEIPGLAVASFGQMDTERYIKYNVSSKVSVNQLFSGVVNQKRLVGVFSGIVEAMLSAEDYMLDPGSLLLDMDYIFTDVSTCETVMICVPIIGEQTEAPDLGAFFKNIIFGTQFDQTENCAYVAQLLNYLNSNPVFSLTAFKAILDELQNKVQPAAPVRTNPANSQPAAVLPVQKVATSVQQPVQRPVQQPVQQSVQQPVQQSVANKVATMDIPVKANAAQTEQPMADGRETMTLGYLLQHYNKENAAIYKAQQEAKKGRKAEKTEAPKQKQTKGKPAQNAPASYAIPGQQEPVVPAYAVPGKEEQNAAPAVKKSVQAAAPSQQPAIQQEEMVACSNCGKPMRSAQAFCTACGTRKAEASMNKVEQSVAQPQVQPQVQTVSTPIAESVPANFGQTVVLNSGIGETTVLNAIADETKVEPYLIRLKNNEKIPLNKPVFRIGKERSYVDYFIGDNTAISRSHANIINHNGDYFVVDTNSTNHTYVNGGMIQSNVETRLSHGAKIRLANEDFEFNMY